MFRKNTNDLNNIRSLDEIKDEKSFGQDVFVETTPKKTKEELSVRKTPKNRKKLIFITITAFLLFVSIVGYHAYLLNNVYKEAKAAESEARILVGSLKSQNLVEIKSNISNTRTAIESFDESFSKTEWMSMYPVVGVYFADVRHGLNASYHGIDAVNIIIETIEPYADIIGFAGENVAADGNETAKDRLDFVVSTISDVIPRAEELVQKVNLVRDEIDHIDPEDYPEVYGGFEIRSNLQKLVKLVDESAELIENGKPLLEKAPYILGAEEERTYLVLFQNDKELRPTGGFLTAYSIARVEKGNFEPVDSDDIYNLDDRYRPSVPAPEPIIEYLKAPYILNRNYRLRDMNWSPDFEVSMDLFLAEARKTGLVDVDGIIAVDTQVLVNILDVLGPIGVPGYGEFSNEIIEVCNCPQVVYELESFADIEGPVVWDPVSGEIVFGPPNMDNRKKIIGPLMNSILSNALGQSKENIPALFNAAFRSLLEKNVLLYMVDDSVQDAVRQFGIAGNIVDFDGDYLHINDANLGGRKSNLYVRQEVLQKIEIQNDGSVVKKVEITYRNPEKHDGWLNSVLPNWVRIYVPIGSELMSIEGLDVRVDPYEELGKTVFSGHFELRPLGVAKVTVEYRIPQKFDQEYDLLIQKQPGKDKPLYVIEFNNGIFEEFFLREDTELNIDLN